MSRVWLLSVQAILAKLIIANACERAKTIRAGGHYARILVQDSTVVHLPQRLYAEFSGVSNGHTSVCNARIQGVYDLLAGAFVTFSIDAYSQNDLSAAPALAWRQGDLVLRDRGYLSCAEIARHQTAGADCIYRHKHGAKYLDPDTGEPIPLAKILASASCLDREVCLNDERKIRVRLVAMPVGEEVANLRRMKAKKEMKGQRPSAELLRLLSWSIFVTTIPVQKASFVERLAIYGLRWRIESIFKAWKGQMNFSAVHQVSGLQLRVLLSARLIMIVLTFHCLFNPLRERIRQKFGRDLSLLKFMRYLLINQEQYGVIVRALAGIGAAEIYLAIARYCTYDKRKGRLNYAQTEAQVFAAIA